MSSSEYKVMRRDTIVFVIGTAPPSLSDSTSEVVPFRNERGDSTGWDIRHTTTTTLDTTIVTSAGSFQCAKRLIRSLDKNGNVISESGTVETYYSVKDGVVQQVRSAISYRHTSLVQSKSVDQLVAILP